jgi:hypothetical protein
VRLAAVPSHAAAGRIIRRVGGDRRRARRRRAAGSACRCSSSSRLGALPARACAARARRGTSARALLVLRRSPAGSRPQAAFALGRRGCFYDLWRRERTRPPPASVPLGNGVQPGAVPACKDVRRLGRAVATIAPARAANVVAALGTGASPYAVVGWGRITRKVAVPAQGRYSPAVGRASGRPRPARPRAARGRRGSRRRRPGLRGCAAGAWTGLRPGTRPPDRGRPGPSRRGGSSPRRGPCDPCRRRRTSRRRTRGSPGP